MFTSATFDFLYELADNNNREWFAMHKSRYEAAKQELEVICKLILKELLPIENWPKTEAKDCMFRIYRDVRFSKNKDPYKKYLSAAFGPGGRSSGRIDYYMHIQPHGESFLGAGIWEPTPAQLAKFRQEIDFSPHDIKNIIDTATFQSFFPEIWGQSLTRMPKGYAEDHSDAVLLKRKQMFFMHKFSDAEVASPTFVSSFVEGCQIIKPFCDYINFLFYDED